MKRIAMLVLATGCAKNAERRLREEQERQAKLEKQRLARERKKLLAMLTPEQRKLLGVK